MQKNGPRRAWKDPEEPRRTQKNRKGPRKQRQTDWSSSFRTLRLFKLVFNKAFHFPYYHTAMSSIKYKYEYVQ